MRAVMIAGGIESRADVAEPTPGPGEARIRVRLAGICGTDLELTRGYRTFHGIPGHEFVGVVDRCDRKEWLGRRVVGEINISCGKCRNCRDGRLRHCLDRRVLGIAGQNGCMADWCVLPTEGLHPVPEDWSDERALFVEPLSSACRILEQAQPRRSDRAVVLGDGPVGILCAWALQTVCDRVLLVGRHAEKLRRASWRGVYTVQGLPPGLPPADLVVEATGAPQGAADALRICRAEGTVVIKTTVAVPQPLQMNELVVKEITLLGSRCGRFEDGMAMLSAFPDMPVERLITDRFAPEQAPEAFGRAEAGSSLKVVMNFNEGTKGDASHGCGI